MKHIEPTLSEQESDGVGIEKKYDTFLEKEFLACLHGLNEKNRADTLSIMWEIMQAKIIKQEAEAADK